MRGPEVRWIRAVDSLAARAWGSVILFDTFDRRRLGWRVQRDRPVHAARRSRCGSAGRRSSGRWRGFGLFESQGRDYSPVSIVNSNHSGNHSRTRLERPSLLNSPVLCRYRAINVDSPRGFEALVISEHGLRISAT